MTKGKRQIDTPEILSNIMNDTLKLIDKKDILKSVSDLLGEYDELLSGSSLGRLVKWACKKSVVIVNADDKM